MIRKILPSIFFTLMITQIFSQELSVQLRVSAPTIQTTDPQILRSLERNLREFMNQTQWTDDEYKSEERIQVTFQITISEEKGANNFKADIAIQAVRPVFGSNYETPILSFVDKDVGLVFEQFRPLEKSRDVFFDNLSSLFSYYAYLILGYDYDSFAKNGGTNHFLSAQAIINSLPPAAKGIDPGWSAKSNKRSRYWLIENLLSPKLTGYREGMYSYHRHGLDLMHSNADEGKKNILYVLEDIEKAQNNYNNSMAVQLFSSAKSQEIIEIYKESKPVEQNKVIRIMSYLDPSNASKYGQIRG